MGQFLFSLIIAATNSLSLTSCSLFSKKRKEKLKEIAQDSATMCKLPCPEDVRKSYSFSSDSHWRLLL